MTNLIILALHVVRFVIGTFIKPVVKLGFSLYYRKQDYLRPLPKCKSQLLLTPAHKLAQKIRRREVSSVELVSVFIERIKEVNPLLNCVVETLYDEALSEARKVDAILASDLIPEQYSEKNAPLLGVPFSCKESFFVKGKPNATGIIARSHIRSPDDADVVKHLRNAGAIMTCMTNTRLFLSDLKEKYFIICYKKFICFFFSYIARVACGWSQVITCTARRTTLTI